MISIPSSSVTRIFSKGEPSSKRRETSKANKRTPESSKINTTKVSLSRRSERNPVALTCKGRRDWKGSELSIRKSQRLYMIRRNNSSRRRSPSLNITSSKEETTEGKLTISSKLRNKLSVDIGPNATFQMTSANMSTRPKNALISLSANMERNVSIFIQKFSASSLTDVLAKIAPTSTGRTAT